MNTQQFIGKARSDMNGYDSVSFGHWLYLTKLGLLLSFEHQRCVAVAVL